MENYTISCKHLIFRRARCLVVMRLFNCVSVYVCMADRLNADILSVRPQEFAKCCYWITLNKHTFKIFLTNRVLEYFSTKKFTRTNTYINTHAYSFQHKQMNRI